MEFRALTNEQRRQLVDVEQLHGALREAERELGRRFAGSMAWKTVAGREYLYRRTGHVERSLGRRSPETERALDAFLSGRARLQDRAKGLRRRLEDMAPVNVALRLARVPRIVARILRRLDTVGLLGEQVAVVGTNALFAYEAAAGVLFGSDLLATGDVDIALDARRRLRLATRLLPEGLIGLLRRVDRSFDPLGGHGFRAVSQAGFMVDLIAPEPRDVLRPGKPRRLGAAEGDLVAAEVPKLQWLIEAPRFTATAVAEDGLPVAIAAADPRFFAAHKLWLAGRPDRESLKRDRDRAQGVAVARLARTAFPHLDLGDQALAQLPPPLREVLRREAEDAAASTSPPEW